MNDRLIISLFDRTGNWPAPYRRAGYPVLYWDQSYEGCILERFSALCGRIDKALHAGFRVHGVLAAPPCTHIAGSGARWWKEKEAQRPEPDDPWTIIDYSKALVLIVLHLVHLYKPRFWVIENPVGRMEQLVPELKPFRRLAFDPCDYGDPYTKRTILWGRFFTRLPQKPAAKIIPGYIHRMPPSPDRAMRSVTPKGFARAFFAANP